MKTKRIFITLVHYSLLALIISCSSADENVKIKRYYGFNPESMKNEKIVFLPFVLEKPSLKRKYKKAFMLAQDKYLKNRKISFPHQTESMLDARKVYSEFNKAKSLNPLTKPEPFVEIGKKVGYRFIVLMKFNKPKHVKVKRKYRKTRMVYDKQKDMDVFRTVNVFVNVNMWFQKGKLYIIDVEKGKCVYFLSKETKSGYNRESTRSYSPATVRDLIASSGGDSIPTHLNTLVLFFKGVFERWKD